MVDAVRSIVECYDRKRYVINLTNTSDGTGEATVTKVDISTLAFYEYGDAPLAMKVMECRWAVQGFTSVKLVWDHTTDDVIEVLSGTGSFDESAVGGRRDPRSAGGTGDILLTTAGTTSGNTYDITLVLEPQA